MVGSLSQGHYPALAMSQTITQKPRLQMLPAMMFAVGLGMAMHNGYTLWRLPHYSAAEIEQSTEFNLAADLTRREPGFAADAAQVERLRAQVRGEVVAAIAAERRGPQRYAAIGLLLSALGLAQLLLLRRFGAR